MAEEKNIQGESHMPQPASDKHEQSAMGSQQSGSSDQEPATGNQQPVTTPQPQTSNFKPETENMEVHKHPHHVTHKKKWGEYFLEFLMIFLAVFLGFVAENIREHSVEKHRAKQFLQSMLLDVQDNMKHLDSLVKEDLRIIANHDSLVNWLLADSATINRNAFARTMGAVWIRNFLVRKETYEQMKSSGSLRYVGNIDFQREMMTYDIKTTFAQLRNQDFERKYYTELFIPALYKAYDLTCQLNLDTSNHSDPIKMEKVAIHQDVLSGNDAAIFRHDMGAALTLRLERLRRSLDAYKDAKFACLKMEKLILEKL